MPRRAGNAHSAQDQSEEEGVAAPATPYQENIKPKESYPVVFSILDDLQSLVRDSFRIFYESNPRLKPDSERSRKAQKASLDGVRSFGHILCDPKYRILYAEDYKNCEEAARKLARLEVLLHEALVADPKDVWILAFGRVMLGQRALAKVLREIAEAEAEVAAAEQVDGPTEPGKNGK